MEDPFPPFIFNELSAATRVDSRPALEHLLSLITTKQGDRQKALLHLSSALTCVDPTMRECGFDIFGHGGQCVEPPTLGEWLAARGIAVE